MRPPTVSGGLPETPGQTFTLAAISDGCSDTSDRHIAQRGSNACAGVVTAGLSAAFWNRRLLH
jgi:hypothetical protein